ncbi:protein of unknown function [Candidatus Promineifilum breve]|uniref:Uncharacterized protein n=1 Tax=Candidatus Promineifilum breve TaxID=1806508 RepID=A0A160T2X1_9CHLR|nr:protein of unknown function [Candidatus Promineifilum breve]
MQHCQLTPVVDDDARFQYPLSGRRLCSAFASS